MYLDLPDLKTKDGSPLTFSRKTEEVAAYFADSLALGECVRGLGDTRPNNVTGSTKNASAGKHDACMPSPLKVGAPVQYLAHI